MQLSTKAYEKFWSNTWNEIGEKEKVFVTKNTLSRICVWYLRARINHGFYFIYDWRERRE